MAAAIDQAIRDWVTQLIDAPPGWGKSLGTLGPIAARDGAGSLPAAYCTGTIALQEQLLHKDIPLVQQAFGRPEARLLKGLGNYVCRNKIDEWQLPLVELDRATDPTTDLGAFLAWIAETPDGDVATRHPRPPWWSDVSVTAHDCLGSKCRYAPPGPRRREQRDADEDEDPDEGDPRARRRGRLARRSRGHPAVLRPSRPPARISRTPHRGEPSCAPLSSPVRAASDSAACGDR
jgi:hypothetical protein